MEIALFQVKINEDPEGQVCMAEEGGMNLLRWMGWERECLGNLSITRYGTLKKILQKERAEMIHKQGRNGQSLSAGVVALAEAKGSE